MKTTRIFATLIAVFACSVTATTSAHAWGCIAVSEEGSYGYSYNFGDRDDAASRALEECAAKTTTESTCEITECDEGS
jgi:hypothetical protein